MTLPAISLALIILAAFPADCRNRNFDFKSGLVKSDSDSVRLTILGDSLAVGLSRHFDSSSTRIDAIVGASSFFAWERHAGEPGVVLVLGSNDAPSRQLAERLTYLAARMPGAWLVGPPCSLNAALDARFSNVQAIQRQTWPRQRLLSMRPETEINGICAREGRAPDGVHFTPAGYRRLADWLRRAIGT